MKAESDSGLSMKSIGSGLATLKVLLAVVLAAFVQLAGASDGLFPECLFSGDDVEQLTLWKAKEFPAEDAEQVLRELAACMAEPDPFLRDEIGFTGLSAILRRGDGSESNRKALIEFFSGRLNTPDASGFVHPLAILGLAELARVDRIDS